MSDDPVARYAEELTREIEDARDDPSVGISSTEALFTRTILQQLEEAGHIEAAFDMPQEGRIGRTLFRISGYALDEEAGSFALFTTVYTGALPPGRITQAELVKTADRATAYIAACLDGLADRIEPSNTDASDLARRVAAAAGDLRQIRVVVLTDAIVASAPPTTTWQKRSVELDVYDIVRLQRVLGAGETRADIAVDFVAMTGHALPCLRVAGGEGEYEAYLAAIPGQVLSSIYDRYGSRLLELNVRAFLGLAGRKTVNAELRRTLVERPAMFLAFNNGVVATADEVLTETNRGACRLTGLKGLQIVNGGQTTASLHRARRKDGASLAAVEVPIKIIRVTGGDLNEMVSSISRAANRQNTVQQADFSANDPFHQEVETLAGNTWLDDGRGRWFYERARGSYLAAEQKAAYRATDKRKFREQTPKTRRFGKLDLARYLAAWDGLPWRVAFGGQKNFHFYMQQRKDRPQSPPDAAWFKRAVALTILYRNVEKLVRALRFPAYGANIVAYLVAALGERTGGRIDFDLIWRQQRISPTLERLLGGWAPEIETLLRSSAGARNPTEWFKKEECWTHLRSQLPALADPLPPELAGVVSASARVGTPTGLSGLAAADFDKIEDCMRLPAATWIAAAEAGQRAGVLHYRQGGICLTLAGYAAGGWVRRPSIKQAKAGLDAVAAVEAAGLISDGAP